MERFYPYPTGVAADKAPDWIVRLVESLAHPAVTWVTEEIYRKYEALLTPLGTRGRLHTQQDLYYHIEFLVGSLSTGEPAFFRDYISWLAGVLSSRGVPPGTLAESLSLLIEFYEQHLDASARKPVISVLQQGLAALRDGKPAREPLYHAHLPSPLDGVEELTQSLINGDIGGTRALVHRVQQDHPDYVRIATRLFQPSLYTVGRLWQENKITVAQEHLATAISQTVLTQLFVREEGSTPLDRKALFACVAGNYHALGLLIVCDSFELAGWSVQFLGANVPTGDLLDQVDRWRPDLVCLSASLVQQLVELRRVVAEMRSTFGANRPTVVVGGLATNQIDGIWRWLGADVWSPDAEKALGIGR